MKVTTDQITETVAPLAEPVTRTEAKLNLGEPNALEDTLVDGLIVAAREYVEAYLGRSLVRRTYRADLSCFADTIVLPGRPIASITNIKYYNTDSPSVLTTLDSGVYALVNSVITRNYGQAWEPVYPREDAVQITYVAGYAPDTASPIDNAANVPQSIKQAMQLIIGDLYENREGKVVGVSHSANPTVEALLNTSRVYL